MTPEWGARAADMPPETQFCVAQLPAAVGGEGPRARHVALLPLIHNRAFRGTLRPPPSGRSMADLVLRMESGADTVVAAAWPNALLVAAGDDVHVLIDAAVVAAASLSGAAKPRTSKSLPPFVDVFGWCTWDAFYSQVSAAGVNEGLASLVRAGVPARFLIIDDGWQTTAVDSPLRPPPTPLTTAKLGAELDLLLAAAAAVSQGSVDSGAALSSLANTAAVRYPDGASGAAMVWRASLAGLATQGPDSLDADEVDAPPPPFWAAARLATLAGWATAVAELAFAAGYKRLVERAPPKSLPMRTFGVLARGPLRAGLLNFYVETTDHVRRLVSFAANRKFSSPSSGPCEAMAPAPPGGLAAVVSHARATHGVRHVLAWHALYGYWAGVAPHAPDMAAAKVAMVAPKPSPGVLDVDPTYAWSPQTLSGVGLATDPAALFAGLHTALADAGVDGVKVDAQATLGMIGAGDPPTGGGPALAAAYHSALEASVASKFPNNALINCMCHSTEALYSFSESVLVRSSDDFWPRDPASHTAHVAVNAANSFFLAPLAQPDWDMFHSKHPAAKLHAAARAVSGGPVYVSDAPGAHDADLLRRLMLPDGRVLRAAAPGRPSADTLFRDVMWDGVTLLKVGAPNAAGGGVVGVFNTQGAHWCRATRKFDLIPGVPTGRLPGVVTPADVPGLEASPTGDWVLWSDAEGAVTLVKASDVDKSAGVAASLARGECDVVTLAPVHAVSPSVKAAAIGMPAYLNTGGAVRAVGVGSSEFWCTLRGSGRAAFWCSAPPARATVGGASVAMEWVAESGVATVIVPPRGKEEDGFEKDARVAVHW